MLLDWSRVASNTDGPVGGCPDDTVHPVAVAVVHRSPLIRAPGGLLPIMISGAFNWGYRSTPQKHLQGRVLYLPRGWLHSAAAQDDVSAHLTVGVHVVTRYALVEALGRSPG